MLTLILGVFGEAWSIISFLLDRPSLECFFEWELKQRDSKSYFEHVERQAREPMPVLAHLMSVALGVQVRMNVNRG